VRAAGSSLRLQVLIQVQMLQGGSSQLPARSCSRDRHTALRYPSLGYAELTALEHCQAVLAHLLRAALPRSPPIRLHNPIFPNTILLLLFLNSFPHTIPSHPATPCLESTRIPSPSAGTRPPACPTRLFPSVTCPFSTAAPFDSITATALRASEVVFVLRREETHRRVGDGPWSLKTSRKLRQHLL